MNDDVAAYAQAQKPTGLRSMPETLGTTELNIWIESHHLTNLWYGRYLVLVNSLVITDRMAVSVGESWGAIYHTTLRA